METPGDFEKEIRELARGLYRRAAEHKPSLFEPQDWVGRMIDWSLEDEALRAALFRFVDVLPSLDSAAEIGRHLREYFAQVDHALGGLVFLAQALHAGRLVAPVVRHNVVRLARRFIVEEGVETLSPVLTGLRKEPAAFTLDVVGEATVSDREAEAMENRYLNLLKRLAPLAETWPSVAIQSYLRDTEGDLKALLVWAKARQRKIGVRLVKGAYWDSEIAWARQKNWPIPVFAEKSETDANYERLSRLLLEHHDTASAAFGSHNIRSLAHAIVAARHLGIPQNGYEIQTLYGMAEPIRHALIQNGQRVRVYVPVGELLPGMAYLIRRLMENTSNTSFLRQTYAEEIDIETLIAAPAVPESRSARLPRPSSSEAALGPFANEPPLDFSRQENRARFARTLAEVEGKLGRIYPLRIGEQEKETATWTESLNPANPRQIVGRVPLAGKQEAEEAIETAHHFFPRWRATPATERAAILFRAASIMRHKRLELAAWEIFEVGKSWREADADVIEAVDYLEYYGREMLRLAEPRLTQQLPGETNHYLYEPRGVAVVIAPWNFPLAILTGMTSAALVAGNCVIVKPAEQSPVMGAHLLDILRKAGLLAPSCQLLQGGGDLGAYLVRHPAVHLIAFTGSREVGGGDPPRSLHPSAGPIPCQTRGL